RLRRRTRRTWVDGHVHIPTVDMMRRVYEGSLRRFAVASLLGLSACVRPTPSPAPSPAGGAYDVVIENGRIVDGTGNPWMYGDVGIVADRIAAVPLPGVCRTAPAKQRVDAHGHIVAPGFIDIQAHSWEALLWQD